MNPLIDQVQTVYTAGHFGERKPNLSPPLHPVLFSLRSPKAPCLCFSQLGEGGTVGTLTQYWPNSIAPMIWELAGTKKDTKLQIQLIESNLLESTLKNPGDPRPSNLTKIASLGRPGSTLYHKP